MMAKRTNRKPTDKEKKPFHQKEDAEFAVEPIASEGDRPRFIKK